MRSWGAGAAGAAVRGWVALGGAGPGSSRNPNPKPRPAAVARGGEVVAGAWGCVTGRCSSEPARSGGGVLRVN